MTSAELLSSLAVTHDFSRGLLHVPPQITREHIPPLLSWCSPSLSSPANAPRFDTNSRMHRVSAICTCIWKDPAFSQPRYTGVQSANPPRLPASPPADSRRASCAHTFASYLPGSGCWGCLDMLSTEEVLCGMCWYEVDFTPSPTVLTSLDPFDKT